MVRAMAMLCAAVLALTSAPGARAMTQVKIAGTYPPGDTITLGRNQNFYLHLAYTSDRPVQIWAQPYFEGQPAKAGSNPSRRYPAGSGEAMGWFFLFDPGTRVDEVRIRAGDGTPDGTPVVATYALSLTGGDEAGEESPPPAWVSTLGAADRAAQRADYERRMNTPLHTSDIAIVGGFMLAMYSLGLIGFAAPAWGLWRWRGGWRLAAAIPMAMMVFVVLRLFIDTARDRTSHNLWPFEILLWGAASVGWMLLLVLARKLVGAKRA